ncbi:hypothetical protein K9M74_00915 [Candidatus Woesearchaeota archaeon]|nr:hypothetical protein [Candidatus Woesearchaeota archaeon]
MLDYSNISNLQKKYAIYLVLMRSSVDLDYEQTKIYNALPNPLSDFINKQGIGIYSLDLIPKIISWFEFNKKYKNRFKTLYRKIVLIHSAYFESKGFTRELLKDSLTFGKCDVQEIDLKSYLRRGTLDYIQINPEDKSHRYSLKTNYSSFKKIVRDFIEHKLENYLYQTKYFTESFIKYKEKIVRDVAKASLFYGTHSDDSINLNKETSLVLLNMLIVSPSIADYVFSNPKFRKESSARHHFAIEFFDLWYDNKYVHPKDYKPIKTEDLFVRLIQNHFFIEVKGFNKRLVANFLVFYLSDVVSGRILDSLLPLQCDYSTTEGLVEAVYLRINKEFKYKKETIINEDSRVRLAQSTRPDPLKRKLEEDLEAYRKRRTSKQTK